MKKIQIPKVIMKTLISIGIVVPITMGVDYYLNRDNIASKTYKKNYLTSIEIFNKGNNLKILGNDIDFDEDGRNDMYVLTEKQELYTTHSKRSSQEDDKSSEMRWYRNISEKDIQKVNEGILK